MSTSLWHASGPLSGREVDIAIVGAGITGLAAAIAFERAGRKAVVLERHAPAAGASGRNAGYLMRGVAANYALASRRLGRETARELWKFNEDNIADLRAESVTSLPSYRARPSCLAALAPEEAAEIEESAAMLAEDGFDAELVRPGSPNATDTLWTRGSPRLGLINPHDAVVNPVELVGLLASRLERTEVHTGCVVDRIEPDGDGVTLRTTLGLLRAQSVLVATNAYAAHLLPGLTGRVSPNRGQMLAARAPGVRLDFAYYLNHGSEYVRQLDDETIIFGGCRTYHADHERTESDETTDEVQRHIERFLSALVAEEYTITRRWAGTMGFSPDDLPMAGPTDLGPRVWFCGGFTGHGMSLAFRTAGVAANAMLGSRPLPAWLRLDRFGRDDAAESN